ncbi:hypothetical protein ACFFMR_04770 [Micromonospora andamanensis]|uniref:Uncharacterized protein n=1 Tax=Micromonospora andamanensis TaxID=1287068 RepID=A0ABQ4I322_9ACTN|nr:hypothetical protein [Micromonospora andamanensis]GIJ12298.1 hypothetical protein Van01_55120 [Micromonospora andamanensis]
MRSRLPRRGIPGGYSQAQAHLVVAAIALAASFLIMPARLDPSIGLLAMLGWLAGLAGVVEAIKSGGSSECCPMFWAQSSSGLRRHPYCSASRRWCTARRP